MSRADAVARRLDSGWPRVFVIATVGMLLATTLVVAAWGLRMGAPANAEATGSAPRHTVFEDDFTGPAGAPADPARWTNQVGGNWNYGRDDQYYTPGTQNAALTGRGSLLISARTETYVGGDATRGYTSARLTSRAEVRYGHVEARLRITMMPGAFPAFWLLGSNYESVGWPGCGELDVMETANVSRRVSGGIHGPRSTTTKPYYWAGGNHYASTTSWINDWHVYGADWTADEVTWTVDGEPYARVARADLAPDQTWAVDQPANLVVNMAVGGYAGTPAPNFAASMEIDWIRVTG